MKFIILASAAAAAAFVVAPAAAQVAQPAPAQPHAAKVQTRANVQADVGRMFARLDTNHDGFVTTAELDASKGQRAGRVRERLQQRGGKAFERIDANKDGQISRQEFDARRQAREQRVAAGQSRMRHAGMAGLGKRIFTMADVDRDGRVSLAEAQQTALAHFDRADLNHDGQLSPQERQQSRQQMRAQRRPS